MLNLNVEAEIRQKATDALKRIRGQRIQENKDIPFKRPRFEMIFEEYDDSAFKEKAKYDAHIYDKLVEDIQDSSKIEEIQGLLVELNQYVRKIYEHINIKPAIYGPRNIMFESDEQYEKNAIRVINEFLNKNYYSLSNEQREAKHKSRVINEAKDYVVLEKEEAISAVERAQKRILFEDLLTRVAFPLQVHSSIQDILESEEYEMFFDKETLLSLYEAFQFKIKEITKLLVS